MRDFEIVKGGIYAKTGGIFAREVVLITPGGDVIYNDYGLRDGAPIGRYCRCSLAWFANWAARPLTPEEIGRLRCDEGQARDLAKLASAIQVASDELIRDEFYRRGLDRLPAPAPPPKPVDKRKKPSGGRARSIAQIPTSYTPLFIEALAYHEAGHVVMCLVLDIPLQRAVIADACELQGYNGLVEV